MVTIKKLRFEGDVLDILKDMTFDDDSNGQIIGFINAGQLERELYVRLNKALDAMGGKWNRKQQGHIFKSDPRPLVEGLLDNGHLEIEIEKDGWFPTPENIARDMIFWAGTGSGAILEPSAGEGHIVDVIRQLGVSLDWIDCVEKNLGRADTLRKKGYRVHNEDFLTMNKDRLSRPQGYERVFMNPPFENGQDIDHVRHACQFLSPGGILVSIMSTGTFYRDDRKATDFRKWFNDLQGKKEDLSKGAFKDSGTMVSAVMVMLRKPESVRSGEPLQLALKDLTQLRLF